MYVVVQVYPWYTLAFCFQKFYSLKVPVLILERMTISDFFSFGEGGCNTSYVKKELSNKMRFLRLCCDYFILCV